MAIVDVSTLGNPVTAGGISQVFEDIARRVADQPEVPINTSWRHQASCRDTDPDLFFPVGTTGQAVIQIEEAKTVCNACPAQLACLEFALRAAIQCKGAPVSVTLSIADTFRTISGDDLDGQRAAEATLSVPPRQLALAASSRFCIADDAESTNELLVTGFTTAHASLRCQSDDRTSAHFASAPLKVRLVCEREADEAQASSGEDEPR